MIEFLKQQLSNVEKELKQLYVERSRSGVETTGSYENMIDRKKKERHKLMEEIKEAESISSPVNNNNSKSSPNKDEIKSLIQKGKIEDVLDKMLQLDSNSNDLMLLSSRYSRLKSDNNRGILNSNSYSIELNKITNSLLSLLDE